MDKVDAQPFGFLHGSDIGRIGAPAIAVEHLNSGFEKFVTLLLCRRSQSFVCATTTFVPSQSLNSDRIKVNLAIDHERALLRVVQDGFETPLKKRAAPVM